MVIEKRSGWATPSGTRLRRGKQGERRPPIQIAAQHCIFVRPLG
jgi:hypothetical protein